MDMFVSNEPGARLSNGKFAPGNPGGGRRAGASDTISHSAQRAIQGLASEAVAKLAEKVSNGDFAAIKYVLDATLPRGGRTIDLGGNPSPNAIIEAASNAMISPDEAARLAQAFKTAGDAASLNELKHQVEQLELLITSLRK
ncbi:hypothetical protein [Novosphingobium sp. CCH12-A3]|uniref:hypothetical protein n=1 Tax=Novosphingobium sp. CCH12-A3 TaxID=1768752 RepID=UPI000A6E66A4|nr:hypothetical protein [Novosphingobium sp. CCH12-A3]